MQLRPYQTEGLNALWSYFAEGNTGNALIAWPTGVGKSVLPAFFIQAVLKRWPAQRFMLLTSVKELIDQNAKILKRVWENAPLGIFSAGLKQKDFLQPIVYAGIQSAVNASALFGHRDIIFIDEAHLLSPEDGTRYQQFLDIMKAINPNVKIIGMTATPFRMGHGMITDEGPGQIFTDIVHDLTGYENFNKLIEDGYLAPLIPLRTKVELDVSDVSVVKGEFVTTQLQSSIDKPDITYRALTEMVHAGANRRSWLIFASGIEHAEHIAQQLGSFGIDCAPVHSKRPADYNDAAIKAFKNNELRSIVNYGKLTTGFDHPGIDLIGDLRPTLSVPLHVQKYGRGTRVEVGKENCLVLDFARNTPRLGPINDPAIPKKKGEGAGDMPVKICEMCGTYNHAKVRFCCNCGQEFTFQEKLVSKAGTEELLRGAVSEPTPIYENFNVNYAIYARHEKIGSPPMVKATYFTGGLSFNEYVCFEHNGYAKKRAHDWWKKRMPTEPPATTDEALQHISNFRTPRMIIVHVNKKHAEIIRTEF